MRADVSYFDGAWFTSSHSVSLRAFGHLMPASSNVLLFCGSVIRPASAIPYSCRSWYKSVSTLLPTFLRSMGSTAARHLAWFIRCELALLDCSPLYVEWMWAHTIELNGYNNLRCNTDHRAITRAYVASERVPNFPSDWSCLLLTNVLITCIHI